MTAATRTRRRVIRHVVEETACDECGWPIDLGDTAVYASDPTYCGDDPDGDLIGPVYCSRGCAASHIGRVERDARVSS